MRDDGRKQKLESSSTYSKVASVQGAAVVARRGLLSPVCLNDRSGEHVLLTKKRNRVSPFWRCGGKFPKKPTSFRPGAPPKFTVPKVGFLPAGPQPQNPHFSFLHLRVHSWAPLCTSPRVVSPPRLRFPFSAAGHSSQGAPRFRSTPAGASRCRSPFPASGPLLRRALRLRFPFSASGQPWLGASGPPPSVPPRANLPSPLRVLFEAPSSLPQGALSSGPQSPPRAAVPRPLSPLALLPRKRSSSRGSLKPLRFRKQHTCSGPQVW